MSKIAITINTAWNIYNFRLGLVKALQKQGFEVVAIAPPDEYAELLEKEGCRYIPVMMESKGSNPLSDLLLTRRLYKIYKTIQPDIVLQYTIKPNIYGTLAARLAGIPVINNVSGLGTVFLHNTLVSKAAKMLYRYAFRYPAKVFFQNKDDRALFIDQQLVRGEITDLVPGSGVDLSRFVTTDAPRNDPFVFLLIARLLHDKGINEYAEAAGMLRSQGFPFRFQLLGAPDRGPLGIPAERLQEWTERQLVEYIPFQKDIRPYISRADCIVLPSYREGTPRTLLEGAAMKKPLIATDVPGCREVVQHGENGLLCRVKDPADLAEKMAEMGRLSEEEWRGLGENSRKLVLNKYDERIVIRKYLEAIDQLLPGKIKWTEDRSI